MMATAAVIGLSVGKRLLKSSSFYTFDLTQKLLPSSSSASSSSSSSCGNNNDHHFANSTKNNVITAKKANCSPQSFQSNNRNTQSGIKALKEHVVDTDSSSSTTQATPLPLEEESCDSEFPVEALLLLQKSILEKQWSLSADKETVVLTTTDTPPPPRRGKTHRKVQVTCSGVSARQRRMDTRKKSMSQNGYTVHFSSKRPVISPDLLRNHMKGYVKGVISEDLLTHGQVVQLSKIIKIGLHLEDQRLSLKGRLGCEPSEEQLANSLRISRAELQSKLIECSLARERLAMSNIRLVMSIAQRYDNMGANMADLIQGGLIGLLRGIEKFDSSKGFKISTYVYWWIRQGVSRAVVDNSRTLRLPTHLHERLNLIRNAKYRLEEKGVAPSIDRIAEFLNMSQKKVRNAIEAISKVVSLDREAYPSLNGLPGETLHSFIADNRLENNPWHGVDEWTLKDEVNKLIDSTLRERERDIIRLYYGLDNECLTWEDISRRIGLSRERVRQVGLVALEKLKHAARKRRLDAMLLKH